MHHLLSLTRFILGKPLIEDAQTLLIPSNLGISTEFPHKNHRDSYTKSRLLPAVATSAALSVMSGVGLTNAFAEVTNTVKVQAKDTSGNA